jgi:hypothetical protein
VRSLASKKDDDMVFIGIGFAFQDRRLVWP